MNPENSSPQDQMIQREIRSSRGFSVAEAIAREGGDFMKGVSPVPPLDQAKIALTQFVDAHLQDSSGVLKTCLHVWIHSDDAGISAHLDEPLTALHTLITDVLSSSERLYELVRQADMRWGEMYDERPHFQQPGQVAHPDDEYTHESVRLQLQALRSYVERQLCPPSEKPADK